MKLRTSTSQLSLKRLVLPAMASTILLFSTGYLSAQAAGSNPNGTPTGQGPATAGQNPPQHKHTPQEIEEAYRRARWKAKKSPKIKNMHGGDDPQTAAIRAALEQLKAGRNNPGNPASGSGAGQTTNAGGSTPGGGTPTGSTPGGTGGGSNPGGTTTGSSNPPAGTPGVPPANNAGTPSGGTRSASMASMAMARPALTVARPAAPPPPSASPATNLGRVASQANLSSAVGCSTKQLMILSINGVKANVSNPNIVFTQDPQYNDYKIVGCNFGNTQGQAHLNGPFRSGVVQLQIKSWTDTGIEVMLDPNLKGEPDQNSVTLVINPVGSAQAQLQNCKFYALRQEITLPTLSQSAVTLATIIDDGGAPVPTVKFSSPYKGSTPLQSGTFTAGVDRYDFYRFNPATDIWDLSNLAPGFVATQFSLSHWAVDDCSQGFELIIDNATLYDDGQWSAQWDPANPKRIIVNVAEQHCHDPEGTDASSSNYALEIQVSGPIGVNPVM